MQNMKRNKGFSMIELLVVLAIASVLVAVMMVSFGNMSSFKLRKSAKVIGSALSDVQIAAMAKTGQYFELYYNDTQEVYEVRLQDGKTKTVGEKNADISYTTSISSTPVDVKTKPLILSYYSANGAFTPVIAVINADGTYEYAESNSGNTYYCKTIEIGYGSGSNKVTKTITLYSKTGKHIIEE